MEGRDKTVEPRMRGGVAKQRRRHSVRDTPFNLGGVDMEAVAAGGFCGRGQGQSVQGLLQKRPEPSRSHLSCDASGFLAREKQKRASS